MVGFTLNVCVGGEGCHLNGKVRGVTSMGCHLNGKHSVVPNIDWTGEAEVKVQCTHTWAWVDANFIRDRFLVHSACRLTCSRCPQCPC